MYIVDKGTRFNAACFLMNYLSVKSAIHSQNSRLQSTLESLIDYFLTRESRFSIFGNHDAGENEHVDSTGIQSHYSIGWC